MARMWLTVGFIWLASIAPAEMSSLFPRADAQPNTTTRASLFAPSAGQGLLASTQTNTSTRARAVIGVTTLGTGNTSIDRLLGLIADAEACAQGYDAVQYGATVRPSKRPTDMTLGEIYQWIDDTPRQPHAIGRYQFIPPTLRRVAAVRGFGPETRFSPGVQDALALVLLEDAGLSRFQNGEMERRLFMRNLARIWAGLPLPSGRSYYEDYAGNKATMTWVTFSNGMDQIWGS